LPPLLEFSWLSSTSMAVLRLMLSRSTIVELLRCIVSVYIR
jgi:hypothetical protein